MEHIVCIVTIHIIVILCLAGERTRGRFWNSRDIVLKISRITRAVRSIGGNLTTPCCDRKLFTPIIIEVDGELYLTQVRYALAVTGLGTRSCNICDHDTSEEGDDCYHDQKFDQGKCTLGVFCVFHEIIVAQLKTETSGVILQCNT